MGYRIIYDADVPAKRKTNSLVRTAWMTAFFFALFLALHLAFGAEASAKLRHMVWSEHSQRVLEESVQTGQSFLEAAECWCQEILLHEKGE